MTYITSRKAFYNGKAIIYNSESRLAIFSVNMSGDDVLADLDGNKVIPEGSFVAGIGVGDTYKTRFLPRTRLAAASATNSASISFSTPNAQFKVGDVLRAKHCYAKVKFIGTFATSDVITAKIGGVVYTATVGSTQTGAGAAADFATANAATLLAAGITYAQVGSTAIATVYANDSYDIYFTTSGAAGQVVIETTEAGYLGDNLTPLGTISAIGTPDATTGVRVVTLAGNAAQALPINSIVGVDTKKVLGLYPDVLDYTNEPVRHIAVISKVGGVYKNNLPYIDEQLVRKFGSDLNIESFFYKKVS